MNIDAFTVVHEDSTFADVQRDLFDLGIPEATMLCSHYGLKPYWNEADPKSKIGVICQTLYAVCAKGVPYILALVRHSDANYPLIICKNTRYIARLGRDDSIS